MALARKYLDTISEMGDCSALARFFSASVEQVEYPNKISPNGVIRDLAAILDGCEKGKAMLSAQSYDIVVEHEAGSAVILEVIWSGTLKVDFGALKSGEMIRARIAIFLEFRNGNIIAQRNYDCFE